MYDSQTLKRMFIQGANQHLDGTDKSWPSLGCARPAGLSPAWTAIRARRGSVLLCWRHHHTGAFKTVGWVNSFLPLIVPAFFGSPVYILLLPQFFLALPPELEDAAGVDGANTLQILWHVILPISRPALATVAIFTFQAVWNGALAPLICLHDQSIDTVSLGLNFFRSGYDVRWAYPMAASLATMLPIIPFFFVSQRQFIRSIAITGMKG